MVLVSGSCFCLGFWYRDYVDRCVGGVFVLGSVLCSRVCCFCGSCS